MNFVSGPTLERSIRPGLESDATHYNKIITHHYLNPTIKHALWNMNLLPPSPSTNVEVPVYFLSVPTLFKGEGGIIFLQKQPPRQFSKISVLFFQEQPFYNFPGGSICSSNRHEFSKRVFMFFEQTQIFQEGLSKRHVFQGGSICSSNSLLSHRTDTNFPRNPYLHLEHIRIFQEPLFSHRTHTHFPGSPI